VRDCSNNYVVGVGHCSWRERNREREKGKEERRGKGREGETEGGGGREMCVDTDVCKYLCACGSVCLHNAYIFLYMI
jgi:hypothetical protein